MSKWLPISLLIAATVLGLAIYGQFRSQTAKTPLARGNSAGTSDRPSPSTSPAVLRPQEIHLSDGSHVTLQVRDGWSLTPAAERLGRARFMARSPDGRLFVPDMIDLTDNRRGRIWILGQLDETTHRFARVTKYLDGLRNPNSLAFHMDEAGRRWIYVALTDRLVRYSYAAGDVVPTSEPQTLATFPDYGLDYKYGGWHLTRTIAFGGDGKLYVSVGSSCNACEEKEPIRACILQMNPDGTGARTFASGLRNAVGLRWIAGRLIATDMGADHLGNDRPEDTLYALEDGRNYGWPYCYESEGKTWADPKFNPHESKMATADVPRPLATFPAHSAPLGVETFEDGYLVALHGSSDRKLARGYRIVEVDSNGAVKDFVAGFLDGDRVLGRPCEIIRWDERTILFTDDHHGVLYCLSKSN